jgi:hypothetical protein
LIYSKKKKKSIFYIQDKNKNIDLFWQQWQQKNFLFYYIYFFIFKNLQQYGNNMATKKLKS